MTRPLTGDFDPGTCANCDEHKSTCTCDGGPVVHPWAADEATVAALLDRWKPITSTYHAVVAGQHLDACIACLMVAELRPTLTRLTALHFPSGMGVPEHFDPRRWCHHCRDTDGASIPWPCPTARIALDPPVMSDPRSETPGPGECDLRGEVVIEQVRREIGGDSALAGSVGTIMAHLAPILRDFLAAAVEQRALAEADR